MNDENINNQQIPSPLAPSPPPDQPLPVTQLPHPVPGKKWKTIFTVLGVASALTIVLPILLFAWLVYLSNTGVSGTEFMALGLIPLFMAGFVVSIFNVILTAQYLRKYHPTTFAKVIGGMVIISSLLFICVPGLVIVKNFLWII